VGNGLPNRSMLVHLVLLLLAVVNAFNQSTYIVVFEYDTPMAEIRAHISLVLGDVSQATHIYDIVLKGFAAPMSPDHLLQISKHPKFKYFEADQPVLLQDCTSDDAPSWGLTRISQRKIDLDGIYSFPSSSGEGVTAYIIDTGIYLEHEDFQGRASLGYKASSSWSDTDTNGHGTHIASIVGGITFGVAKKTTLVAVKVFDSSQGSISTIIAGVNWATGAYKASKKPGVANLSLFSGSISNAFNDAVTNAMREGLFIVVAAGNNNEDACRGSPAAAKDVVTVGGIGAQNAPSDTRSYFSNFGPCVKILAPSADIPGAWIGSRNATRILSGTSFATPHVCGVAALIYGEEPNLSWQEATTKLVSTSTKDVIDMNCGTNNICQQTPNSMVFTGCEH